MPLRMISLVLLAGFTALAGCGAPPRSDEPTTAREKQRREAEASGATDAPHGKLAGWRYTGDRNECFFIVGKRCFKSEAAACKAARCGSRACATEGGGPATVSCAK